MKKVLLAYILTSFSLFSSGQMFTFTFEGIERSYKVHLPPGYNPDSLYPVVFNLHGYGSNAIEQQLYSGFDFVADTAGIVMVYPNGVDNSWNVYGATGVNDVGFISALIDTMAAGYSIDLERVYSTGMSMGGFMSYRLACELDTRIAAIASVTGLLVTDPCAPSRPVGILQMHGTADPTVPYSYVPLTIDFWTGFDNCPATPVVTDLPDIDTTDNCTVTVSYYGLCDDSTEVILYTINGGEHTWPGALLSIGVTNQDINGSVEIWNFFKHYSLSGATGIGERHLEQDKLAFYPNPFHVATTLEINGPVSREYFFKFFDQAGRLAFSGSFQGTNRQLILQDGLLSGIYYVEVTGENFRAVSKLIVQ
jgi:polyhydroxybutyrate depolymerase